MPDREVPVYGAEPTVAEVAHAREIWLAQHQNDGFNVAFVAGWLLIIFALVAIYYAAVYRRRP